MSYLRLNNHTLNCNNIFKYIKKSEDANRQFWLDVGLSKEDIKLLVDMEADERPTSYPLGYYASRKYLLEVGKVSIGDVINDIEEYKSRG